MDVIKLKSTDNARKLFPYNANSDLAFKSNKTWGKISPKQKPRQYKKGQTFVGKHRFLNLFLNFNQLPVAHKGLKNSASKQMFGPSYFDRAFVW